MKRLSLLLLVAATALSACHDGAVRAFTDGMNAAAGYQVYYPDSYDVDYVGDVKWTQGTENNSAYQIIQNTGSDYCKVRIRYENGEYDFFYLSPRESTGRQYVDIYNQEESMDTLCGPNRAAFDQSFSQ